MTSIEQRLRDAERRAPRARQRLVPREPANIIEFATDPFFLGVPLYPVQGTILKAAKGDVGLLTDFDLEVISAWEEGWELQDQDGELRYVGTEGTPPGLVDRMRWCTENSQRSLSEVELLLGRRAGKGVMAAILVADLIYDLLCRDGRTYDVKPLRNKALAVYVMGAKYEQAKRNAFSDIKDLIRDSPAFEPFLGRCTDDSVSVLTPSQLEAGAKPNRTVGRLQVRAVETTPRAGRGPTMVGLVLDEFAHIGTTLNPESRTSSIDIYRSVTPALATMEHTSLILQTSSPWEKDGQMYRTYLNACTVNPDNLQAKVPSLAVIQLPSWATYEHWKIATMVPMWPGGPCYPQQDGPQISQDGLRAMLAELDPDGFRVEFGAQFASSVNPYLNTRTLARLKEDYDGQPVTVQTSGVFAYTYAAHGDPSRVGANFGFSIAHKVYGADGIPHVIFDDCFAWHPADFPDRTINYITVEDDIKAILRNFPISTLTFDQYSSAGSIDRLLEFAATHPSMPVRAQIFERTSTAPFNWRAAETFKTAAMLGLIHIPAELTEAHAELEHLQVRGQRIEHPTHGSVTTKDIADSIINVVWTLLGEDSDSIFRRLADLRLHAHPGITPHPTDAPPPPPPTPATPTPSGTATPAATPPANRDAEIHAALSNFGNRRAGLPGGGNSPARGYRTGRGRHR